MIDSIIHNEPRYRHKTQHKEEPLTESAPDTDDIKKQFNPQANLKSQHKLCLALTLLLSTFTTFYKIWFPAEVVFDEVHFGKFAGLYLQRTYFFDVHPPLAKLMLAAVGYLIGFDGKYQFSHIGESYAVHRVPYVLLRAFPASLQVASVGLVYLILKASGHTVLTCGLVAALYALDNGFIGQNRLILLDSILIFYMLTSVYCFVKFRRMRYRTFSKEWWGWLIGTGVCMSLTLSVKMIGLFIFAAIGVLVIKDLWDALDLKKHGMSSKRYAEYFGAHVFGLIVVPICIYLFWFYIHFAILNLSGPGNHFMSPRFQDTLGNSQVGLESLPIQYHQAISFQHKETKAFLNANNRTYPATYPDGRRSSRGIQVAGTRHTLPSIYWRILPVSAQNRTQVRHNDVIQLEHVALGLKLMTHDVAAPLLPSHQEFTLTSDRHNHTLFRVVLDSTKPSPDWTTRLKYFKLIHLKTNVALFCNSKRLPEWGLRQLEVNGNKRAKEFRNDWVAMDILGLNATEINLKKNENRPEVKMGFFEKFWELQLKMISHNNKLNSNHPYRSKPYAWPLMWSGIAYWAQDKSHSQIYLTGNVVGWWTGFVSIVLFVSLCLVDQILLKRQKNIIHPDSRKRLYRTGGFFLMLWAFHYFPFYLMGRSLYLHHYLPAMACNYLLLGSVFEYLFVEGVNTPVSDQETIKKQSKLRLKSYLAAAFLITLQYMMYSFLSPMTYGTPGLTTEEATRRKILDSWNVRFAKYISEM